MKLQFSKMHGLGNDFVVIDAISQTIDLTPSQIRFLADRHFGVGCDQVLLVERPTKPSVDFRYRIFNADGGEVEQCGNGARCFARFVREQGMSDKNTIAVETNAGDILLTVDRDEQVTVNMGVPHLEPAQIPFAFERQADTYTIDVNGELVSLGTVSIGNPHAVIRVSDVALAPVSRLGPLIERHAQFPKRVNVGFMQVLDPGHIKLRVFERGAGETLACGTGACAAVVVGNIWEVLESRVKVDLPGGSLLIQWLGEGHPVMMTGPATTVFTGTIEL
jgi:diaminopimelate epimerase